MPKVMGAIFCLMLLTIKKDQSDPAPLSYSSADGCLQVYGRDQAMLDTLLIIDSPPVMTLINENQEIVGHEDQKIEQQVGLALPIRQGL